MKFHENRRRLNEVLDGDFTERKKMTDEDYSSLAQKIVDDNIVKWKMNGPHCTWKQLARGYTIGYMGSNVAIDTEKLAEAIAEAYDERIESLREFDDDRFSVAQKAMKEVTLRCGGELAERGHNDDQLINESVEEAYARGHREGFDNAIELIERMRASINEGTHGFKLADDIIVRLKRISRARNSDHS